ncbi:hypothetical protein K432DRAFT_398745 [Lepidopterella palustris CBS 459.81]|uniref:Uncharacterized protein n=1 Tax=Lepidopterella palustris CBS 459.81 TaxID=1314670 RepID=A0A8E2J8U0_9PEZI|nr:hypothetical protein K432DRAFT_398745 [Lepidopterella palustris CBS 459.81]
MASANAIRASAFRSASDAMITHPAELVKRQPSGDLTNNPSFIGYYYSISSYSPQFCTSTQTWTTSSSLAMCCDTSTACTFYMACSSFSYILAGTGGLLTCPPNFGCETETVFYQNTPVTNIGCFNEEWKAMTVYRDIPAATSSFTSTKSSSTTTSALSLSSSLGTSSAQALLPPTPTAISTAIPMPTPSKSKESVAWPVIGSIAATAIIAVLIFWIWRLKRLQYANAVERLPSSNTAPTLPESSMNHSYSELDAYESQWLAQQNNQGQTWRYNQRLLGMAL